MTLLPFAVTLALAQSAERPDLPFRSAAGEDGAHVLYLNPALMNFDRDAMYAAWYQTTAIGGGLNSLAVATTGGGIGAGIAYRQTGADASGWWSFSSGASVRLSNALSIGSAVHWQLPEGGDNNFVSWDLGAGWRPVPWLGFGGSVLNLGSPAPELGVNTRYDGGLAIRPWGDVVTLGLDWIAVAPPDVPATQYGGANLRLHPIRGVWLRGWAEVPIIGSDDIRGGGALELRFADVGVGIDAATKANDDLGVGAWISTIPRDDQLFQAGRDIAVFALDRPYDYAPAGGLLSAPPESYLSLLQRIRAAGRDPQVKGILVQVGETGFSLAQLEEIRGLLQQARGNRKPVVAYLGGEASNGAYLLASGCDKVFLHPAGDLDLIGLGAELQFYRGALDLVGVENQFAKRSEYKSAPEQWTNTRSSDASREQLNALLDDLSGAFVDAIAVGRGKTAEDVRRLVDGGPYAGAEALDAGLVDGLAYPDELERLLAGTFPRGFTFVRDYMEQPDQSGWEPSRAVAVVTVDGVIAPGRSTPGGLLGGAATGSETVVDQLDRARHTGSVKAVVLRVDSPGGSSFASDEIWRAVTRLEREGKPVVVSMGGYAASGGYYVSAGARAIYALPSTVTGSIGVYGGKVNLAGLYEKLHVNTERYDRGRNASMYSSSVPLDDVQLAAMDRLVESTYRQFKQRVEEGRNLSADQVELVARGRVWSGRAARERGLVDVEGGMFDAIERAREEAGLRRDAPFSLVVYDGDPGLLEGLPSQIIRAATPRIDTPAELRPLFDLAALKGESTFAILPYHLEIQ